MTAAADGTTNFWISLFCRAFLPAARSLELRCLDCRLKRQLKHFIDRHHGVEVHLLANLFRDVVKVAAVALREDNFGQARGVSGQRLVLLLYAVPRSSSSATPPSRSIERGASPSSAITAPPGRYPFCPAPGGLTSALS